MTFNIITLGCKVNVYESEIMKELLLNAGYKEEKEHPEVVIINTCSVTNMADSKSRKMVRTKLKVRTPLYSWVTRPSTPYI